MSSYDRFDLPDGYGGIMPPTEHAPTSVARPAGPMPPHSATHSSDPLPGSPFVDPSITQEEPADPWPRRRLWLRRAAIAAVVLLLVLIAWLAIAAPVSRTAQPLVPPQLVIAASDGTPIARTGAIIERPVVATQLPDHVIEAFLATEDRRFRNHWGVDPYGIGRAAWSNMQAGSARQGGSTITQQLAKLTYLTNDRTFARKIKELPIAVWLEVWLSKDEILERYLSNAYFGDNVYGLRAASLHYFYRQPERLTLTQAAMLAGLVKAPSRLAPTRNLKGAQDRERVVIAAMVDAGYLTSTEARAMRPATVDHRARSPLPRGTYFADWATKEARGSIPSGYEEAKVVTTLDHRLQALAERVTRYGTPGGAQVALVAMRPNGEVVAMVGGNDYRQSAFNRASQAKRQPGSTFKLAIYLAALRSGMTPETLVDDSPITTGAYRPANAGKRYRGQITLKQAFVHSSNVVAVKLYDQLGKDAVQNAADALGMTAALPGNASVALGSADNTLLALTAAYAGIAAGEAPVVPHALAQPEPGFIESFFDDRKGLGGRTTRQLREMLRAAVEQGTGQAARLAIPAYGKTGTTQDSRDALFVGYAGDLIVGVWIGRDDNKPLGSASGGGAPARIWRDFMIGAIPGAAPRPQPQRIPMPMPQLPDIIPPEIRIDPETGLEIEGDIGGVGITIDRDGVRVDTDEAIDREIERRAQEIERRAEELGRAVEDLPEE